MVKVYCDRCGKKLNTNDPHYYPLGAAANGDDIFFAVSVYTKSIKRTYDPRNKEVGVVDDSPNFCYDYNAPDLCTDCMREINQAVKTVWDGKNKVLTREIYGVCDDEKEKLKACVKCKYHYSTMDEDLCKLCGPNHANWEPRPTSDEPKTCGTCKHNNGPHPLRSCLDCGPFKNWEPKDAEK